MPSKQSLLGSTLTLRVGNLTSGGAFVCTSTTQERHKKVFVRNVAPGEIISAVVEQEDSNLLHARFLEILEPSQLRVSPPCKYFTQCGGCNLQHLTLETQRQLKLEMVESMLARHARITPSAGFEFIGEELPGLYYRRRVIFHVGSDGKVGFYRQGTYEIIELDQCLISSQAINEILIRITPFLKSAAKIVDALIVEEYDGQVHCKLRLRENIAGFKSNPEFKAIIQAFPNISYETTPAMHTTEIGPPVGHFSQVNSEANQKLVELVESLCPTGSAITELYAGAGNFSFALAKRVPSITAVEMNSKLVSYGQQQQAKIGIPNLKLVCDNAERFARNNKLERTVLLDPPRQGAKLAVERFNTRDTKKIIYVSCSLPTLTRDLKILIAAGFCVEKVYLLDMFPQTYHIETVTVLRT